MPRPLPDPEIVTQAHELHAVGCPLSEIAGTLGVTKTTVSRWLKQPRAEAPAPAPSIPSHMAPPAPPAPALEVTEDTVGTLRAMLNRTLKRSADAEASGNHTAAQREGRDAAMLMTVLARESGKAAEEGDMTKITRSEVAKIEDSLRERIASICTRPLLCSACSRALSVAWGAGEAPP